MAELERQKILIINDSEEKINTISQCLPSNCKIITADSGEIGLSKAFSEPPDLIVLDLEMEGMSGREVYQFLQHGDHTKDVAIVILLDSYANIEVNEQFTGHVDFLLKPIQPQVAQLRFRNLLKIVEQRSLLVNNAKLDVTTGAANRQSFNAHLEDEWRRCMRSKKPLSLVKMNPDFFKMYNDRYGFDKGDLVLRAIANAVQGNLHRPGDMIGRFDGANFFILLPEVNSGGAKCVTERLRLSVESMNIEHGYTPTDKKILTVSMSGSSIVPDDSISLSYFIDTASMLLDKARQEGGNKIKWYL